MVAPSKTALGCCALTQLDMLWEKQIAANCFGSNSTLTHLNSLDIILYHSVWKRRYSFSGDL